jgi:hypothetical protein
MALGLRIDKLYFYLLTSGTSEHLVCQAFRPIALCYTQMWGITRDRRLSPLAADPSTMEYEANEGSL